MDDDDDFLYGGTAEPASKPEPQPISYETISQFQNSVVAHLESVAHGDEGADVGGGTPEGEEMQEEEEEEVDMGGSEDEDVEFIMEPHARSLDFRQTSGGKPPQNRTASTSVPAPPKAGPTLTTEYTPMQRGTTAGPPHPISIVQPQTIPSGPALPGLLHPSQSPQPSSQPPESESRQQDDGIDPSTLPPVTAPPSHPVIDPTAVGILDGRSIFEVDMNAMAEKPWRRPGSDISDWFNYGFDEISWEAYCYRRRDLGEMANVLKTNVINFSAMPEDQLTALPPEVRQMVMTGTTAMMNGAAANPGMMAPGVMMDMSGMMGPMGMGMGMGGDMGMGGGMMQVDGRGMMPDGPQVQQGVGVGNGTPEQVSGNVGMMQDGYNGGAAQGGMMNIMGGGGDFGMQDQGAMGQQIYPAMEAPAAVPQGPVGRGATPVPYRGRAQGRGRGFSARGRGRGGMYAGEGAPPTAPVRPASPLPPGVPTGPRNQNKYKDRDGNAPAVDGLDYGGNNKDLGGRTPSGEPEDRISSRKRRSSPGLDDGRGSKRR